MWNILINKQVEVLQEALTTYVTLSYTIDNQKNGLETQAKASMLLTRHPWYGLICYTLEPCNFTLNILQDFLFTHFKQERQCLCNYRLLKFFMDITKLKPNAECLRSFWLQKCRHCCCWKRFTETLNGGSTGRHAQRHIINSRWRLSCLYFLSI